VSDRIILILQGLGPDDENAGKRWRILRFGTIAVARSGNHHHVVCYCKIDGRRNFSRIRSEPQTEVDDLRSIAHRIAYRLADLECIARPAIVKSTEWHNQGVRRECGEDARHHRAMAMACTAGFEK